jgi:hypothetical protein
MGSRDRATRQGGGKNRYKNCERSTCHGIHPGIIAAQV